MKNKGFTLIELLAVIIILGVLLLIAIPSVTEYISTSRKKTYLASADKYVGAVVNKVNSLDYNFNDKDTLYYVPYNCVELEKGGKSPYGNWKEAYVVVVFNGEGYKYYWTSVDDSGMGIPLTLSKDLDADKITGGMTKVDMSKTIEGRTKLGRIDASSCSATPTIGDIPEGGEDISPIKYTVNFDCDEIECGLESIEVENGKPYGELPTPARVGYTFLGWYTAKEDGEWIKVFTIVDLTADQTLYAKWEINKYTISYNCNGVECSLGTKEVTYGQPYGELATSPTRSGYTFLGWYTADSGGSKIEDTTNVTLTADQTLYAQWSANSYSITFNANGGSGTTASKACIYGTNCQLTSNGFSRTGYTFLGWSTSSGASSATYINGQNVNNLTTVDGDTVTLYSIWQANTYTVIYNCNGISCTLGTKTVTYGSTYGTLATPPERVGYTFEGWYTATSGGSKIESTTNVTVTTNQTLYAQWKSIYPTLASQVTVGEYVNYDAGTWSSTVAMPTSSTPFTFGGYTAGSSRNSSVTCERSNERPANGWRVLSKNASTGEVKLIHAGQPECYYHPNLSNSRGNSEKILSGSTSYTINGSHPSTPRGWSMYVNSAYAVSATAFTKSILDSWYGSPVSYGTTITNDLIRTNAFYWLGSAYPSITYGMDGVGYHGDVSNHGHVSYYFGDFVGGVRPVITMKLNITTSGKVGNVWQLQ